MSQPTEPNVFSFVTKKVIEAKPTPAQTETQSIPTSLIAALPHDEKSVKSLNNAMEAVMSGECSGLMIIGTGKTGLPRFWITVPEGKSAQHEAVRYIGLNHILNGVLEEIVYNGVELDQEGED